MFIRSSSTTRIRWPFVTPAFTSGEICEGTMTAILPRRPPKRNGKFARRGRSRGPTAAADRHITKSECVDISLAAASGRVFLRGFIYGQFVRLFFRVGGRGSSGQIRGFDL